VFLFTRSLASGTRLWVPTLLIVVIWDHFHPEQVIDPWHQFWLTGGALVLISLLTAAYTAVGGIKAVIWTDVLQILVLFAALAFSLYFLLGHIPGSWDGARKFLTGPNDLSFWQWRGDEPADTTWGEIKSVLASEFTIWSAFFGSLFVTMATHGTDQDMVQRMLTAETHQKAKRSLMSAAFLDIPIAAIFTFIGILLFVYYQQDPTFMPKSNADIFSSYILNVLPVGLRGLVLAGVFATAMGSLSAALNALATSATNDWYVPFLVRSGKYSDHNAMHAARWFTAIFSLLMFIVAGIFAYMKVADPSIRIIPVVLGIASYIVGPMLGVFLIGMLTKDRGSDTGNAIAVCAGLLTTGILGYFQLVSFTWFALIGSGVVVAIGVWFRTPAAAIALAKRARESGIDEGDVPMFLRKHLG
jgi:Na+/proline symporter